MSNSCVEQILSRGTKYLCLSSELPDYYVAKPNFQKSNQLKYLDIGATNMERGYFLQLILSCHKLEKLSIRSTLCDWSSKDLLEGILKNASTLKVLDLQELAYGLETLKVEQISQIVTHCLNLTEANFGTLICHDEIFMKNTLSFIWWW